MSNFSFGLLTKGGPMMWVLLLLALLGLVFFIERALYLHRSQIAAKANAPCRRNHQGSSGCGVAPKSPGCIMK